MSIPALYHEQFSKAVSAGAGATTEIFAIPTNGDRYWVTSINCSVTTAGAAGSSIEFRTKHASAPVTIHKLSCAVVGHKPLWFGERGFRGSKNHGLEIVTPASAVCEVTVTGYIEKMIPA